MSNSVRGCALVKCLTLSVPADLRNHVVFPRAGIPRRYQEQKQVLRILSIKTQTSV